MPSHLNLIMPRIHQYNTYTTKVIPKHIQAFDTVFSMGVLYHRKSPFEHLEHLRSALRKGGEIVLETLVVDGNVQTVFVPRSML